MWLQHTSDKGALRYFKCVHWLRMVLINNLGLYINPSDAETRMIWDNEVNTRAVDALAPCVTRMSWTMVLIMQDM